METDVARKLRINLARWRCFSFRITTEATLVEDIAELLGLDPKRRYKTFYEEYTRSGIGHSITLRFARRIRQPNLYAIRLVYETEEPKEFVPKLWISQTTPKPSEVFLHLCDLETTFLFRCDCSFSYRREDKEVPFPLPIKVEDELFDEVRGVRFVKLEQDRILWENSLNLIETDLMIHRIKFASESNCSLDLLQRLLRQAREISRKT